MLFILTVKILTCQKLLLSFWNRSLNTLKFIEHLIKQLRLNQTMELFYAFLKRLFLDGHYRNSGYFVLFLTILFIYCASLYNSLVILNVFYFDKSSEASIYRWRVYIYTSTNLIHVMCITYSNVYNIFT